MENLTDLECLVKHLGEIGINKAGRLELVQIGRDLAEIERRSSVDATRKRKTMVTLFFHFFENAKIGSKWGIKRKNPPFGRYWWKKTGVLLVKKSIE